MLRWALLSMVCVSVCSMAYGALTLTLITSPDLGKVFTGGSGRQFILNTSGAITGTHASEHVSGQVVGQLTVQDSTSPLSISIVANNISTLGGLTVNQVLCSYNGGAQSACDGAGLSVTSVASATLNVGIDISTTQVHTSIDSASVTMDILVSYL